ncbi:HD domain-containing phosphohydrolase [Paraclostridium bifermentans]|uniref:HD domain-containing phosphohydrolase n=1 Tax=Paraclostridium bifermentans TaxID=1490 RepID=UPI00189E7C08|nr:HD domain-containing phosphohydrolase [Paraclostridium bifermentans]
MNKGLNIANVLKTVNSAYERFDKDACLHSLQVAYLTLKICKNLDIDEDTKNSLVIAAYFHDFSAEKTNMCDSLDKYEKGNAVKEHCILGYLLFKFLLPKSDICKFILYHHNTYDVDYIINNIENPLESNIIKLADDISIYNIFNEQASVNDVIDFLNERSYMYNPNYLNRFLDTNAKMAIENVLNESYKENFWKEVDLLNYKVITIEDIIVCLAFIIDCKCDITNFHSLSVSNTSCMLGKYFNLSENEYYNLKIGSLLHDIGKIAIPNEILKKEGPLTKAEFEIMKQHVVYTYEILSNLKHEHILNIASNHHEKLNGKGYPRGLSDLTLSEKIVAVADIFVALIQKRSYKDGFSKDKVIEILSNCANKGEIDGEVVKKVIENYDYLEKMNNQLYSLYNHEITLLYNEYNNLLSKL